MSWRVLHLHGRSNWGGNLEHVRLVMAGLSADPAFALFLAAPPDEAYLARFRGLGATLVPFEARSRADLAAAVRIVRLVHRLGIALVHSHLRRTDWMCAWARPFCPGVRWVTTVHGAVNRAADYARDPGVRSAVYARVLRHAFDRVLSVSHDLTRQLRDEEGVPTARLATVVNGVDVVPATLPSAAERSDARARLGLASHAPTLVMAGRFGRRKGHDVLLRALAAEAAEGRAWQALLLGDGDLEEECRRLARGLGLEAQVRFLGFQPEPLPYLVAAEVVAVPSHSEGLPRALLEGMAAGLAPVASDIGGVREVLEAPRYGLTFPAGDHPALAAHLRALWSSPDLRKALGTRARARVAASYSSTALVSQHDALYRALLGDPRGEATLRARSLAANSPGARP